jgi:hypothetical protein
MTLLRFTTLLFIGMATIAGAMGQCETQEQETVSCVAALNFTEIDEEIQCAECYDSAADKEGTRCSVLERDFCRYINDCNCDTPCKDSMIAYSECLAAGVCGTVSEVNCSAGVIVSASFLSAVIVAAVGLFSFA